MKDISENSNATKIELTGHKAGVAVVKFSKDGEHILSGSQDRTIKLWNPYKSLMIQSYNDIHSHDVLDIAISQDNSKFASVGLDKQAFYVDSPTGKVIKRFYGHTERINSIAFNRDESVLVTGSYDCTVRIWDLLSQSRESIQILNHAKDSITKVMVLNEKIISSSVDGGLRVYDLRMGQVTSDNFEIPINGFDVGGDEKYMIVSGLDDTIRLFETESGQILKTYSGLHSSRNYSMTVKYSLDLDGIYTTSESNDIAFYDLVNAGGSQVYKGHGNISCGFDTHPFKKNYFVSSGYDGKIILWDRQKMLSKC